MNEKGGCSLVISMHTIVLLFSCAFAAIVLKSIFPAKGVEQITVCDLNQMLAEEETDYQYIDVRPPHQFNELHVFGFKNIPLKHLKQQLHTLSKHRKVVVISQRGNESNEACKLLKRNGFSDLANVRGGIVSWEPHV